MKRGVNSQFIIHNCLKLYLVCKCYSVGDNVYLAQVVHKLYECNIFDDIVVDDAILLRVQNLLAN